MDVVAVFHLNVLLIFSVNWHFVKTGTLEPVEIRYVISNYHQTVSLMCNISERVEKMSWHFKKYSNESEEEQVYDDILIPKKGYRGECDGEKQFCNLVIEKASKDVAGRYRFEYGHKGKETKIGCIYELIVGDLKCSSNIRDGGLMVGENDCPVKPETLKRSCSFHHHGNHNNPLSFNWMKATEIETLRHENLRETARKEQNNEITSIAEDEFEISNDLQGSIFLCHLGEHSLVKPCQLPSISVQYAKSPKEPITVLENDDVKDVDCSLSVNKSTECSYFWLFHAEDIGLKIYSKHLLNQHLLLNGEYKCMAECNFVSLEKCLVPGMVVSFNKKKCETTKIVLITLGIVVAFLTFFNVILLVYICRARKKKKKRIPHNRNN